MNRPTVVIPFDSRLAADLRGYEVVLRLDELGQLSQVHQVVEKERLKAVWVRSSLPLSALDFEEGWEKIPVALYVPEMGSFLDLVPKLTLLKDSNIRVFLPANPASNLTQLRMLASLGVHCGVCLSDAPENWDALNDLMSYSVYSRAERATVEPFQYLVTRYNRQQAINPGPVSFDAPERFLHLDSRCRIALTDGDLRAGRFIAEGLGALHEIDGIAAYQTALNAWRGFFLKDEGCAYCESWRVCMGRFESCYRSNPDNPECRSFFADLIEAAEFFQNQGAKEAGPWQY